ncbi:uncharacterized protein EDB91DRAFT_697556 [Suillus paluster]|uniref:uncharacterized protein n=1 Tax=Suillus paluster TaxID=48578 RepID=UPI001B869655|nr:uncharacterized protein EDB91DRAFT_697556 [Suillus paluster]KAG1750570.1 hypothetical protein EDB91DRAFT_697556 [Suillus paluster]
MPNMKPTTSSLIALHGSCPSSDRSSSSSDFIKLDSRHMAGDDVKLKLRPVCIAMKKAATVIHARPHTLTAAVKTMTRALTGFRKGRLDKEEVCMASPHRDMFRRRTSVRIRPEEPFYSLPNLYFSVHTLPMEKTVGHHAGRRITSRSPSSIVHRHKRSRKPRCRTTFDVTEFVEAVAPLLSPAPSSLPVPSLPSAAAHVPLADPTPEERESSQRIPGYLESTQGIRRFAHWADCAFHHTMVFLALVVALVWYKADVGVPVACGLMSRFMYVWSGFQLDSRLR